MNDKRMPNSSTFNTSQKIYLEDTFVEKRDT